jgi:hypothetical protein
MTCTGSLPACNSGSLLQSITVSSPATTLIVNGVMQFTATGHYRNGSTANITSAALWSTDSPLVALISQGGVALGVQPGSVTITAGAGSITGFELVTITP